MKERTRSEVKGIIYTIYKVDGRGLDQGCQTYKKVCELMVRTGFVLPF